MIEIYSIYMVTSAKKHNQVGVEYQMIQIHVRYKRNNSDLVAYTFNGFPCTCIDLQNKCRLFFSWYIEGIKHTFFDFYLEIITVGHGISIQMGLLTKDRFDHLPTVLISQLKSKNDCVLFTDIVFQYMCIKLLCLTLLRYFYRANIGWLCCNNVRHLQQTDFSSTCKAD